MSSKRVASGNTSTSNRNQFLLPHGGLVDYPILSSRNRQHEEHVAVGVHSRAFLSDSHSTPATATDIPGHTCYDSVDNRIHFGDLFATDGHYYDRITDAIYRRFEASSPGPDPEVLHQSNLLYEGEHVTKSAPEDVNGDLTIDLESLPFETPSSEEKQQLGHSRLAKEVFDYLLKPGGTYIELTFHGTAMPARLGYQRTERAVFDPIGEAKAVIGSVDTKVRQALDAFLE